MPNLNRLKRGGPKSTNVFNDDDHGMSERRRATFAKTILARNAKEAAKAHNIIRQPLAGLLQMQGTRIHSVADRLKLIERSGLSDADAFIHETAIIVVEFVMDSGNASGLTRLYSVMPNGTRREKLTKWLDRFTPFAIAKTKKGVKAYMKPECRDNRLYDRVGAMKNPFYTLT